MGLYLNVVGINVHQDLHLGCLGSWYFSVYMLGRHLLDPNKSHFRHYFASGRAAEAPNPDERILDAA